MGSVTPSSEACSGLTRSSPAVRYWRRYRSPSCAYCSHFAAMAAEACAKLNSAAR